MAIGKVCVMIIEKELSLVDKKRETISNIELTIVKCVHVTLIIRCNCKYVLRNKFSTGSISTNRWQIPIFGAFGSTAMF